MEDKISRNILVVILLSVIWFLNILSIRHKTKTYDENRHYRYGSQILQFNSDRFDDSKMPFSCLNAIPWQVIKSLKLDKLIIESASRDGWTKQKLIEWDDSRARLVFGVATGRFVTILFSLLLAIYVYKWSKELYGIVPGLFSLVLYTFAPNIIAHSRLVTSDLYATVMITISTYYFWQFIKFGGWNRAALSALTLGLSQLAKYTCVYLYPIFLLTLLIKYSNYLFRLIIAKNLKGLMKCSKSFSKFALFFLVVSILIINIGFLFNKSFTPLGEYKFKTDLFKSIQSKFILKYLPVPVPYPYLEGLDWVKFNERVGKGFTNMGFPNIYLLGKLQQQKKGEDFKGFKGYYFYAFLFKVPIAIQLFILFSIIAYVVNRKKYNFLEDELFLMCPVLFFTIYFNFFFRAQIGIRFFIVVFPLLYVFCGSFFKNWETFSLKFKSAIIFLVIYLIISVLSYFPHYLSYFNEFVWDRKQAYKILADSNIDWGQNRWYLAKYKEKHPDVYINPEYPVAGRIVLRINNLVGVFDSEKYRWLRENFEPIDHIAYSYLVYDIPPEALDKIR